jgi:hypothetical protein
MRQIPGDLPHPDRVQRIKNVSAKLSTTRQELMKAHRPLDQHLESWDRAGKPEAERVNVESFCSSTP